MSDKELPRVLDRSMTRPGDWMQRERLELEFSNGVKRTYSRLITCLLYTSDAADDFAVV